MRAYTHIVKHTHIQSHIKTHTYSNESLTGPRCVLRGPELSAMAQKECLGGILVGAIELQWILRRFSVVISRIEKNKNFKSFN